MRTPLLLSIAPSSTQTQLKRKCTHQEHPLLPAQTATWFHHSESGWGQGPPHPGAQSRWPCSNAMFFKEEPRAGCLYQHSCGSEPRAETIPSCVHTSWGHPSCTALMLRQPHTAGKLCPPPQTTPQLDFTCNHQEHTALTQDYKNCSEEDLNQWQAPQVLGWLWTANSHIHHHHWASALAHAEKHVELVKVVNSRLLVCTIHSHHCIITLHNTLSSLISHPPEENHQIGQLVPHQNKQGRMAQFSTNIHHKVWASPSISS